VGVVVSGAAAGGTHFTCFTGTKVQILTYKALGEDEEGDVLLPWTISKGAKRRDGSGGVAEAKKRRRAQRSRRQQSKKKGAIETLLTGVKALVRLD